MKFRLNNIFLVIAFLGLLFSSCDKTTSQKLREEEDDLRNRYIERYHPGAKPTDSGLYYFQLEPGDADGDTIKAGDYVKVFYEGYIIEDNDTLGVIDGYNFDSSGDYEPFAFSVGQGSVIAGWDEGITYMKDGEKAKLVIPSELAYGSNGQGPIEAYSSLVFYITVYKVYRSTDEFPTVQKLPKNLLK
jgi:FKBP-type peptidyl-prolyl cis-trans isomerase